MDQLERAQPLSVAVDLERPATDPWDGVQVPRDWRAVAALARRVAAELDDLADHIVGRIQAEVPAYGPGVVPTGDVRASVTRSLEMMLVGVAEHRRPTEHELAVRRELGVRRARQGLPVDALVQAYHLGYGELWQAMVRALPPDDAVATTQLLEAATTVWSWVHDVTDAIAAAHAQTTRQLEARVVGARQRFVELLARGDLSGTELAALGRSLGFDPAERFRVAVLRGAVDDHDAVDLQRHVERLDGHHTVAARGELVLVVSQGADAGSVVEAARLTIPGVTVATGLERPGWVGARASLVDAERTLDVTADGDATRFEDVWLWATIGDDGDRLSALLAVGVEVAGSHPHLAEAVRAFGAHGFSVSEAARQLAVHANTVGYRLDRWAGLTGWDPRTFPGLVRSLAAIRAAAAGPHQPTVTRNS